MNDKHWKCLALLACALALAFLSGCTLRDQNNQPLSTDDKLSSSNLTVPKYADPGQEICREIPGSKPCYCMACTNKTSYGLLGLGHLFSTFFDSSLATGNCSLSPCNETDYYDIVNGGKDTQMRTFALGTGQSFASSGMANLYCNYSLQFATKWMRGSDTAPPAVPLPGRASCWLNRSAIPIYIYYTGGKDIDPAMEGKLAKAFNDADVGPAFVTTEAGWDGSDAAQVSLVKQQVLAIDKCDKCLTVLAVQPNDYQALYNVMGMPNSLDHDFYDKIDAVGFGFRANDYPDCDAGRIIYDNLNFSRYILQKYNKPTIWLYVGASEGNGSAGGPDVGGCSWSANDVQDFYSQLLSRTGGLASSGVLGMSTYEFVDNSGPLPCLPGEDCNFGMLYSNGTQKHPELNSWSDVCQEVNINSLARKPLMFSRNGQGMRCDLPSARFSDQALMYEASRIASGQGVLTGLVAQSTAVKNLGCGETCPGSGDTMPKPAIYDQAGTSFSPSNCTSYPLIDERADDFDISSTYLRAIIEQESGFDANAVSNASLSNLGCNNESMPIEKICEYAGIAPADCPAFNHPSTQKPCAYGLAQCIEYPGQYYARNGLPIPDAIKGCGGANYNPFNPGDSACCGAWKFANFLRNNANGNAEAFVNSNWAELSKCQPDGLTEDERGWAAYYIASNRYYGADSNVLSQFVSERDNGGACHGSVKNYIEYLREYAPSPAPGTAYGAQVMSRYSAAVTACKSDCPA